MTTISLGYRAVHNKIKSISLPEFNWKFIYVLGIALCLVSLVFYIILVNKITSSSYLIRNYNKQITSLTKENRNLEASFAKTGFLDQLRTKTQNLGFEKISEVKYIEILNTSLARAK